MVVLVDRQASVQYRLVSRLTDGEQHTINRTKMLQNMIMYMQGRVCFFFLSLT